MDEQEFERDEQLLEARRLKRLEQRRRRKVQQRIVLGVLLVILILSMVLIVRGCKSRSAQQEQPGETADAQQNAPESVVPTEPDTTVTIAAVGDIMMYDEQLDAARQDDGTYDFTSSFAAVSGSTVSADLTVGNLELNFCGAILRKARFPRAGVAGKDAQLDWLRCSADGKHVLDSERSFRASEYHPVSGRGRAFACGNVCGAGR
mgnify:CR=1 FL=1